MRLLESSEKVMGWCTAWRCKMLLFHAKTIVKESCTFELAHLKEKKKKKGKYFGHLATFWFSTFKMSFQWRSQDTGVAREQELHAAKGSA